MSIAQVMWHFHDANVFVRQLFDRCCDVLEFNRLMTDIVTHADVPINHLQRVLICRDCSQVLEKRDRFFRRFQQTKWFRFDRQSNEPVPLCS